MSLGRLRKPYDAFLGNTNKRRVKEGKGGRRAKRGQLGAVSQYGRDDECIEKLLSLLAIGTQPRRTITIAFQGVGTHVDANPAHQSRRHCPASADTVLHCRPSKARAPVGGSKPSSTTTGS